VLLAVFGLFSILAAVPMAQTAQEGSPAVQLEVELPAQGTSFSDPTGLTIRIEQDESVLLRLRVFEASDSNSPVTVDDPTDLFEIRGPDGKLRISDWNRTDAGIYETTHIFRGSGDFELVVLPDVEDRDALPLGSSDRTTVVVEPTSAPAADSGFATTSIIVLVLLVVGVATLVAVGTRGRRRSPKGPALHDTWWNGP
jgi:hypothetical protein